VQSQKHLAFLNNNSKQLVTLEKHSIIEQLFTRYRQLLPLRGCLLLSLVFIDNTMAQSIGCQHIWSTFDRRWL